MTSELDLNQSREAAKEALRKVGLDLEQMEPFSGVRPVETAFEIKQIPLEFDGSLKRGVDEALELLMTPPQHVYTLTTRFSSGWGGYSPDVNSTVKEGSSRPRIPTNVKEAIEIGVSLAKKDDYRATEGGFSSVDISCFPFEWKWGKNPGEPIFKK